jgi:hypothetical protein
LLFSKLETEQMKKIYYGLDMKSLPKRFMYWRMGLQLVALLRGNWIKEHKPHGKLIHWWIHSWTDFYEVEPGWKKLVTGGMPLKGTSCFQTSSILALFTPWPPWGEPALLKTVSLANLCQQLPGSHQAFMEPWGFTVRQLSRNLVPVA